MVTFHKENKSKVLLQMLFACAELPAATLTHFRVDVAETLCSISSCLWSDDTPDLQIHLAGLVWPLHHRDDSS